MYFSRILKISVFFALLFFPSASGVVGQPANTGTIEMSRCWSYALVDSLVVSVLSDSDHFYLGMAGGKLEALRLDGRKVWSADLGGTISSNLTANGSSVVLITSPVGPKDPARSDATLRSLSKETGITQWTLNLPDAESHYLHPFNGWIIAVSQNGTMRAIEANSGKILWKREITSGFKGTPFFAGTAVLTVSHSNQIFKVSIVTGEIEGMQMLSHPVSSILMTSEGSVVVGDERGNIISIQIGTMRQNWRFKSGGQISTLLEAGPHLLATSHDNFVYSIESHDGDVNWKRRLAGRPVYAARIPRGYVLLSSLDDEGVILVDLNNGKVVGHLDLSGSEKLIAEPIFSDRYIYIVTSNAAHAYSTSGCGKNSEGGAANKQLHPPSKNNLSSETVN